jgi:hypothetical protein
VPTNPSSGASTLRERAIEITQEYWATRERLSERVAVAQLILALARAEDALNAAAILQEADRG